MSDKRSKDEKGISTSYEKGSWMTGVIESTKPNIEFILTMNVLYEYNVIDLVPRIRALQIVSGF